MLLVLLLVLLLGGLGALVTRGLWLDRQAAPSLGGHLTEADVEAGDAQGWLETCERWESIGYDAESLRDGPEPYASILTALARAAAANEATRK